MLDTQFPLFFTPKNRTRKLPPSEEAHVHPLEVRAGSAFIRVGGSRCAYQKKIPGTYFTFDLRSDWSYDLKSGLKCVPGIVLG